MGIDWLFLNMNKNLTTKEIFALALENHQKNNLDVAINFYNQVLEKEPNHQRAHNNLGVAFQVLKKYPKARDCYKRAIEINPRYVMAHNNLAKIFEKLEEKEKAINCYEKASEIDPNFFDAPYSLGKIFDKLKQYQKAVIYFEKAIEINPNHESTLCSLGMVFQTIGEETKAKSCYEKTIKINPNNTTALNNLALSLKNLGDYKRAKECYENVINIDSKFIYAYWGLHGCASDIDEALLVLKRLYKVGNRDISLKIMLSVLQGFKGDFNDFNDLLKKSDVNHPYIKSAQWVFSQPKLPRIYFKKSDFFNSAIKLSENSRPFYEFGVWRGNSFKYLINTYKKGFGFDTFTGLPEKWSDSQPIGTYSSYGVVPKIDGGEFIVGKFEETLPNFFSKERPIASLINFDADLYSSTLCALKNSNKVIDDKTILIFDELIMTSTWEEDEYKALNEFCTNMGFSYEVLAISFTTGQVAIKLKNK